MSFQGFTSELVKTLIEKHWGTKIRDENGVLKDTGVQEFAEELLRALSSLGPIPLNRPIEFINKTDGPAIKIFNDGPNIDWQGVRVEDRNGNQAQLGIGLGSEGITANNYVPFPGAWLDPEDMHRFYSVAGGNAGGNRNHPRAVEAGNGLGFGNDPDGQNTGLNTGRGYAIDGVLSGYKWGFTNYVVPIWMNNFWGSWAYQSKICSSHYRFNMMGDNVYMPTYIPQMKFVLGKAVGTIAREDQGTVNEVEGVPGLEAETGEEYFGVWNRYFRCIEDGDIVLLSCNDEDSGWEIIATPPKIAMGLSERRIERGEQGTINETTGTPGDEVPTGVDYLDVWNRYFGCIEPGDAVLIQCIDDATGYEVISTPIQLYFAVGTTNETILKGDTGLVTLESDAVIQARSPFALIDEDVIVAVNRDNSENCGEWIITAAECF